MEELKPGIYHLELPLPNAYLSFSNAYLIKGDGDYLLFDTGWSTDEVLDSLEKQLAETGITLADISQVIASHIHPDHYGLAGKIKELSQAQTALHYLDAESIWARYVEMADLLDEVKSMLSRHGVPDYVVPPLQAASLGMARFVVPIQPDIKLRGDETISIGSFNFQVIWTPGHSVGHICLYEPEQKIIMTGDHILPTISPHIGLHPQSSPNPLGDYLNSVNKLKELEVNLVLPGHGAPFRDLPKRIRELNQHHEQRKLEIMNTIKTEPKTAYQISAGLTWIPQNPQVTWDSLDPLNKRAGVMETLAHLEDMLYEGRVKKSRQNSLIYYQPAS